ncbi:metal ABC transporter permease [Alicyclobacillus fastidiosus]|uniref:Metal ABC transporter permease n=1 Tax=Alicyclobacillus fastidiosus TaxID=392011 RepID=A0ABY6ZKT3_9BACL|nr:metal ABC transporter permease [Alicyclobacillus fastidiosus]WAH43467.1 metal ABC transporter permease [Alicyclobacillus fastidiosus]GMA59625.1 ABC transporter permease [Alicyclobacillus fastidiosus]
MTKLLHVLFAPGLFTDASVGNAILIGTVVAIISGVVGVFVVIRGQSYLGHALGDFGATGASVSFLLGLAALWGFLGGGFIAGAGVDVLGQGHRRRGRDVTTGVIHAFVMGLGALFLYFDTTYTNTTGAPMTILFGSIFLIDPKLVPTTVILGVLTLVLLLVLYRPLLLSSLDADLAKARGIPVRWVSFLFMCCMAMAVSQSSLVIGALLSTALLIGPAATAIRLTKRTGLAMILSAAIGTMATWLGIVLAYDSYDWPPTGRGWPVSFFVTSLVLLFYLISRFRRQQPVVARRPKEESSMKEVVTHGYRMEHNS